MSLIKQILVFFCLCLCVAVFSLKSSAYPRRHGVSTMAISMPEFSSNYKFDLGKIAFSLIPLSPESLGRRKTLLKEIVKDKIWTLDQLQGIINVNGKKPSCYAF